MRRITSRVRWTAMVGLVALVPMTGCITLQLPEPGADNSPGSRYLRLRDSLAMANGPDAAEEAGAPRIRIQPSSTVSPARYVDATFRVSEDAYVLVVAVDLDRHVRVLFPESPDESGFVHPTAPQRLTRFFAGFATPTRSSFSTYARGIDRLSQSGPNGGGVFLAVASDRPLQFDRLAPNGEWDEKAIEQLVFETSPSSAAYALGHALSLTGQQFSTDFTGFFGRGNYGAYSLAAYSATGSCDAFASQLYGNAGGPGALAGLSAFTGTFVYGNVRYARYVIGGDSCSGYRTLDIPIETLNPNVPGVPVTPRDSAGGGRHFIPRAPTDTAAGTHHFLPSEVAETRASGLRFRPVEQLERPQPDAWMRPGRRGMDGTATTDVRWIPSSVPRDQGATAQREQPRAEPRQEQPQHFVPQASQPAPAPSHFEPSRPQKDPQH